MSNDMRRDISELKQAVESTNAALRQAVESLNATNAAVVSTNARLGSTNTELNSTNSRLNRTMISVAQLVGGMADMKQYLAENMATKKDMSDLNSRMDGFSGLLLESRPS